MRDASRQFGRTVVRVAPHARLVTVGHGTVPQEAFARLLADAGIDLLVDVRSAPGSRRFPQFNRAELEVWVPAAGIEYRWERDLGGFRRPAPGSPNVGLRHPSFRGYADYMGTDRFRAALGGVLDEASRRTVAVMCAETLWWRCHRRLIADAATLLGGAEVYHLGHDGRLAPHRLTEGVQAAADGYLIYGEEDTAHQRENGAPASGR